jgi:uncharacterized protein (TIGR02145 family)
MRNLALVWVLAVVAVALLAAGDGKPPVSTFTDSRDGKVYKIVKIGGQTWFAENLNYASDGSECHSNSVDNCNKYGRLYDWTTAMKICPSGWNLPSNNDWTALMEFAGGRRLAGTKLKATSGWNNYHTKNGNGTDDYGFSALPCGYGGYYSNYSTVNGLGENGHWWSDTGCDSASVGTKRCPSYDYAYSWGVGNSGGSMGGNTVRKIYLYSVRCVLDDEKEAQK